MEKLRILHFADSHMRLGIKYHVDDLPPADICVISGDLCKQGNRTELTAVAEQLRMLSARYPIGVLLVVGNHEINGGEKLPCADSEPDEYLSAPHNPTRGMTVRGLRFYGIPWFVWHNTMCEIKQASKVSESDPGKRERYLKTEEALRRDEGRGMRPLLEAEPFDVLISHAPPKGYCDANRGSEDLLRVLRERGDPRPGLHLFGHMHGFSGHSWGMNEDRGTLFVNSALAHSHDLHSCHMINASRCAGNPWVFSIEKN